VAVLDEVRGGGHQSAGAVAAAVRSRLGTVSVQAVYDALDTLVDAGLLNTFEPAGSPALFEESGHPHHHGVCRVCGAVVDIPIDDAAIVGLRPSRTPGFRIEDTEVTFWGRCSSCRSTSTSTSPS
jgi:Fur family ferric uptake transcriptional regulator